MAAQQSGRRPRIGYLVGLFPKLSESFVLNEVVHLQRRGLDIVAISFDRSRRLEEKVHAAAGELKHAVIYAPDAFPWGHLAALLNWLVRSPLRVFSLFVANQRHPAPRGENKLGRFLLTVYTGWLVRKLGIEHLHAHWSYPCDVAQLLSRYLGVPFSFTAHAHDIYEDIPLYEEQGFGFADRVAAAQFVVACTEYNLRHIQSVCPEQAWPKLHHAYHGLDTARFAPGTESRPLDSPPVLLSVGRFVPYKGFDTIVRACERLHREGRKFRCWLVGPNGSQTEPVRAQIHAAGLDGLVEQLGPQTQEELVELYRKADIYVNASNPEGEYGVANVIVEALATGLPTIATVRPQVEEYIQDGLNGLLVTYGDDGALASAMARLLDDEEVCQQLGSAARSTVVERFSIEATTSQLERLFSQAAASVDSEAAATHAHTY